MWLVIEVGLPRELENQGFHGGNFLGACDRLGCVVMLVKHSITLSFFAYALWLIDKGSFTLRMDGLS